MFALIAGCGAVSPFDDSAAETLSTLLFGQRARAIPIDAAAGDRVDYREAAAALQVRALFYGVGFVSFVCARVSTWIWVYVRGFVCPPD